jgi:hypothetical protein
LARFPANRAFFVPAHALSVLTSNLLRPKLMWRELIPAIDRSDGNWNKMRAMTRSIALAMTSAAAAAPASYYYRCEAGTS